jgi:chaperonin GroEL
MLKDIAVMAGCQAVTEDLGLKLENLTLNDLGRAKTITADKDKTILIEGGGTKDAIRARVKQIQTELENTTSEYDKEKLQERLAKIAGGVAVIKVGAATESEMKEKKARVEDALHATRAAVEEGIVPGGGVALLRTLPALENLQLPGDQQYGVNTIRRALEEPLRQIAENAGVEGAIVVNRVREGSGAFGYNAATNQYEDLVLSGVIDPTKVVRVALQNAASVASLMLTTEALIATRPSKESEASSAGMQGGMDGMGM